jgi:hypothetical protein
MSPTAVVRFAGVGGAWSAAWTFPTTWGEVENTRVASAISANPVTDAAPVTGVMDRTVGPVGGAPVPELPNAAATITHGCGGRVVALRCPAHSV